MIDNTSSGETNDKAGSTRNNQNGVVGRVVQARDIHGDINLPDNNRRAWLVAAAVVLAAVLVGAGIVLWPRSPATSAADVPADVPAEFRVTADLSANDTGPWGYVSESPDFPGAGILAKLSHPEAAKDDAIVREVRLLGGASLERHLVRLHLEGPRDREVTVTDIRPVIRRSGPPLAGSLVWAPPQGAEESSEVLLALDDPFPVLQASVADQSRGKRFPAGPFFPSHTIKLRPGETHEVVVTTSAHERSYDYELTVIQQSGTKIEQSIVNDAGRPFRVSGFACSDRYVASYRAAYKADGVLRIVPTPDPAHVSVQPSC